MLVEVTLKEFQNLAQLPNAKIVEKYGDSAPVVELGDNKRYFSYVVNLEYMNKTKYSRFTRMEQLEMLGVHVNNNRIYSSYNSRF